MTTEQLRIRVAELCGWTHIYDGYTYPMIGVLLGTNPSGNMDRRVPDYPCDLNAMQSAELAICPTEQERKFCAGKWTLYADAVLEEMGPDAVEGCVITLSRFPITGPWLLLTASAEQRARAFVRVMEGR